MNTRTAVSFVIFMALSLLSLGVVNNSAADALPTAKTRLASATADARKWQPDAVLVLVETSTATPRTGARTAGCTSTTPRRASSRLLCSSTRRAKST